MDEKTSMLEVDFYRYCPMCKHKKQPEWEEPCNDCMVVSMREQSRKPEYFEEAEK